MRVSAVCVASLYSDRVLSHSNQGLCKSLSLVLSSSPPPLLPPLLQGDKLYGRGTTDCLGHVALITELFIQLAQKKPKLKYSVVAVFIAA